MQKPTSFVERFLCWKSQTQIMGANSLEHLAIAKGESFPIKGAIKVYNGKVRVVTWLSLEASRALAERRGYSIHHDQELGVMITTDGLSAFDTNWEGERSLKGVPGKGAALNHITTYFFRKLQEEGVGNNHIVEVADPLTWIVKRAQPIRVEGIQRRIITGSMFRAYQKDPKALFCGHKLPAGLQNYDELPELLLTPSTKGTMHGLVGVPAKEDTPISRQDILNNYALFGFKNPEDVSVFEEKQRKGFPVAQKAYAQAGYMLGDMKVEIGYVRDEQGDWILLHTDEFGTPDAIRSYKKEDYHARKPGMKIPEKSKEAFRDHLLSTIDPDLLLNDARYEERKEFSRQHKIPVDHMMDLSILYLTLAEGITGTPVPQLKKPREHVLNTIEEYGLAA